MVRSRFLPGALLDVSLSVGFAKVMAGRLGERGFAVEPALASLASAAV